jgi:hypothetical protein
MSSSPCFEGVQRLAPSPMAPGIEDRGFLLRADLIRNPQPGTLSDSAEELQLDLAAYLTDVVAPQLTQKTIAFADRVQIINTLFEAAAALATVVPKLDALREHAVEGLELIGGTTGSRLAHADATCVQLHI